MWFCWFKSFCLDKRKCQALISVKKKKKKKKKSNENKIIFSRWLLVSLQIWLCKDLEMKKIKHHLFLYNSEQCDWWMDTFFFCFSVTNNFIQTLKNERLSCYLRTQILLGGFIQIIQEEINSNLHLMWCNHHTCCPCICSYAYFVALAHILLYCIVKISCFYSTLQMHMPKRW